jgi:hypothetical protein
VVKFDESDVMRLKQGGASAAPSDAGFTFLVDEDEEYADNAREIGEILRSIDSIEVEVVRVLPPAFLVN